MKNNSVKYICKNKQDVDILFGKFDLTEYEYLYDEIKNHSVCVFIYENQSHKWCLNNCSSCKAYCQYIVGISPTKEIREEKLKRILE